MHIHFYVNPPCQDKCTAASTARFGINNKLPSSVTYLSSGPRQVASTAWSAIERCSERYSVYKVTEYQAGECTPNLTPPPFPPPHPPHLSPSVATDPLPLRHPPNHHLPPHPLRSPLQPASGSGLKSSMQSLRRRV